MTETKHKGKLVILSAPSGSGKTTIARHLLESDLDLMFSISACSREKRDGEQDGVHYYFLSPDEFREHIDKNEFLEWEEVYPDHYYGTLKREVERIINSGYNAIFDVDVVGGLNIKGFYGDEALSIFIQPPHIDELEKRLNNRSTDSEEKIRMRLDKAHQEMSYADQFDLIIVNEDLEVARREAFQAVKSFLTKTIPLDQGDQGGNER